MPGILNLFGPAPATTVTSLGAKTAGSLPNYALEDHVHNFGAALQRKRIAASASTVWTFDTPFAAGVIPVIGCLIESPDTTANFAEPRISSVDNGQVTLVIKNQANTINILALGLVTLFSGSIPANTFLHVVARDPNV